MELIKKNYYHEAKSSQLQKAILNSFQFIGSFQDYTFHTKEPVDAYSIDIVMKKADKLLLLIEVHGPFHFDSQGEYTLFSRFRHDFLRLKGYSLVNINYKQWNSLADENARMDFLERIITKALKESPTPTPVIEVLKLQIHSMPSLLFLLHLREKERRYKQ